uniref:glutathione gamma-glutamylcysteinyltransferase n=1 Tax=Hemiselmis andersenii TaxID=464988 RepID=A0A6U2AR02_HEMAN|mmetsp:Transcript_12143/g.28388  ORF Transcript_12143/g.28388 Transcript_12143/m.28388 type:complete len:367 (+) Transcript_12143:94-1194(+)|eukprot:CAMPEP_0114139674 /NCGR_PEP_ID=MMETSP0043_2-20121206/16979_1 /TAXON_ID=464988 /ORGANISM="Hemiselmis andersenii, Strain CCMP644" /LENGTH=366 /DNA_ID=CAMNT_0001233721 /DNA_START=233 /DNA_END=1333 /DNA_ORIENTATION=-
MADAYIDLERKDVVDEDGKTPHEKEREAWVVKDRNLKFAFVILASVCVLMGMFLLASTRFEHTKEGSPARNPNIPILAAIDPSKPLFLNTTQGSALLRHHETLSYPYFEGGLATNLESQWTYATCGPASIVTVLNALNLPQSVRPGGFPLQPAYRYFRQDNLFNECMNKILPYEAVFQGSFWGWGVTLHTLSRYLSCYASSDFKHADEIEGGAEGLRQILQKAMTTKGHYIIANFHRTSTGYPRGGGHHSPIAAYSPRKDMALILDVAPYRYPPMWVPVAKLMEGIDTTDSCGEFPLDAYKRDELVLEPREPPGSAGDPLKFLDELLELDPMGEELLTNQWWDPQCTKAQRGIALACAPGSEPCVL